MASGSLDVPEINLNKICRICLRQNIELHSIYSNENSIDNIKFKFILSTVTSLEFKEKDGLPTHMCAACIKCASNAFTFKRQSERAHSALKSYFHKKKNRDGETCNSVKEEFILLDPPITVKCEFNNMEDSYYLMSEYDLCQDSDDDVIPLSKTIGNVTNNKDTFGDTKADCVEANNCNICNKIIGNMELEIHKKQCCELFSKSTKVESGDEELKCGNFMCPLCYKYFGSAINLECHRKICDMEASAKCENSKDIQTCIMCSEKFKNEVELLNHIDVSHNVHMQYFTASAKCEDSKDIQTCMMCSEKFKNEVELLNHGYVSHNVHMQYFTASAKCEDSKDIHTCIMCSEKFNNEDELLNHVDVSHNELMGPRKRGRPSKKDREAKKLRLKTLLDTMKGAKLELTDDTIDMDNDKIFLESCTDDLLFDLASNGLDLGQQLQFCTICCNTFSSKQSLEAHMKEHFGTKLLICNICRMMFLKQNDFKRHFISHNTMDLMSKVNFTSKLDIFPDTKQQLDNQADDALLSILPEEILEDKIVDYFSERSVMDVLDEANIKLEMISDPEKLHIKRNHCIHLCAVCGGVFLTAEDLLQHTDNEHGENNYKCELCNKVFATSEMGAKHRKYCERISCKHQCPTCGLRFGYEMFLNKHILSAHKGQNVSVNFLDPTYQKKEKPFTCQNCNKSFYRQEHLSRHAKIHMPNEKKIECNICQRKFNRRDNLRSHMRVHEPNKHVLDSNCLCVYCGRSFSNSSNLIVHMRRHTGEKPYKCDICEKGFPRSSDLQCHRRTHTGEKPCLCTICGKGFSRTNKLARHMRIHTGQRPYKCTYCERAFAQSNDLTLHIRRHTGNKPYGCGVCGQRFIQGTALQVHRRLHNHFEPSLIPELPINSVDNPHRPLKNITPMVNAVPKLINSCM